MFHYKFKVTFVIFLHFLVIINHSYQKLLILEVSRQEILSWDRGYVSFLDWFNRVWDRLFHLRLAFQFREFSGGWCLGFRLFLLYLWLLLGVERRVHISNVFLNSLTVLLLHFRGWFNCKILLLSHKGKLLLISAKSFLGVLYCWRYWSRLLLRLLSCSLRARNISRWLVLDSFAIYISAASTIQVRPRDTITIPFSNLDYLSLIHLVLFRLNHCWLQLEFQFLPTLIFWFC